MKRTISSLINKEYKNYSIYVCYHRAIPNLIDGFKPSQRKAFYVMPVSSDFKKVQSVAGKMISDAEYNHGDASASKAISMMAQDFVGANNIPVFEKKGSFGSRFIKTPSAPRYIYVKANKQFYSFFKDHELCPENRDPENPEPEYYLPVIPTILLNGISGIAVGFATEIQPYNLKDIVENIRKKLENRENPDFKFMYPHFKGYEGDITYEDGKFIQYGIYEIVNTTTIKVTEVPTSLDREKYKKHLSGLVDKKLITSYTVNNIGQQWDVTIKLPRASEVFNDPIKHLKLSSVLTENITVINENEEIVVFDNVYQLLNYFVEFRLGIYQQRIDYMLDKIKNEVYLNQAKIKFIIEMNKIEFKKMKRSELKDHFLNLKFDENHLQKCFEIKTYNLNIDYLYELKARIEELKKEYAWYKQITPEELYKIDLDEIKIK